MIAAEQITNPFPGLRPFEPDQADLFFGRDEQIEELLERLHSKRFIAVVGTSGSGKSSLVRAGLIPNLESGYFAETNAEWRVSIMRPGARPIVELARSLGKTFDSSQDEILVTLSQSSVGLTEFAQKTLVDESLLLVVDQFEEVFRYRRGSEDRAHAEEAAAFVKLFLTATGHTDHPTTAQSNLVYVILTMRSDFLGSCSRFRGLPEALNDSQYLVPRLTRDQQQQSIEGPIAMAGARITPRLVQRLLNDVGDDPDQLPVLQHALMRTWEQATDARARALPIDISDYGSSGEMQDALNKDAERVFETVRGEDDQQVVRRIFQRLVEPSVKDGETRRPTPLSTLVAVTDRSEEKVRELVAIFQRAGFLTISEDRDPIVDITHESLIRLWKRLNTWVREEVESAKIYTRLADSAKKHTSLYRDPELAEALGWKEHESPNAAWAERYPPWESSAFPVAMEFLEESKKETERQLAIKRRNRLLLVGGLVGAVALAVIALASWFRAEKQRRLAIEQQNQAIALKLGAEALALTKGPARLNQRSLLLAIEALRRHESRENDYALRQAMAKSPVLSLRMTHDALVRNLQFSRDGKQLLSGSDDKTVRIWDAATGQELDRRTFEFPVSYMQVSDSGRHIAISYGPPEKEDGPGGRKDEKDSAPKELANKLSVSELNGPSFGNTVFERVFERATWSYFNPAETRILVASVGRLYEIDLAEPHTTQEVALPATQGHWVSDWGDYFAASVNREQIQVFDTQLMRLQQTIRPRNMPSAEWKEVYPLCWAGQLVGISAAFDTFEGWEKELGFWNVTSGRRISAPFAYEVENCALSPSGEMAAIANKGTVVFWSTDGGKEQWSAKTEFPDERLSWRHLKFSNDNARLVQNAGDRAVRIYDIADKDELFRIGLDRQASAVALSPDGQYVAVGDTEGSITLWRLQRGTEQELYSDVQGYVSLPDYSPTGKFRVIRTDDRLQVIEENGGRQVLDIFAERSRGHIFSRSERYFVLHDADGILHIYDLSDGRQLATISLNDEVVTYTFTTTTDTFVVVTRDGLVSKWNPVSGQSVGKFETGKVSKKDLFGNYDAYFSKDAALCVIKVNTNQFNLWNVESGVNLGQIAGMTFWRARFSPDGKLVAVNDEKGISVWQTQPLKLAWRDDTNRHTWDLTFSPDGKKLAAPLGDDGVVIWEAVNGQSKISLKREVHVEVISFAPDSKNLAATYGDGSAYIWRLEDKTAVAHIPLRGGERREFREVDFSPDGRFLFVEESPVAGQGNAIRKVWWHPEDLIDEACRRVERNLTPAEWEQYLPNEPYRKTCPNLP